MSAAVTKTSIINAAAALLGSSERISDIESSGRLATASRALWELTIRTLLAEHPWNFAIKRATLNPGPPPAFGYSRSYGLPTDCVRVLASPDDCRSDGWRGEVENGAILTDADGPVQVRYVSSGPIDDCGRWSPHFAQAAIYALAMALAEDLTGSESVDTKLGRRAEDALMRAKRVDSLETHRGSQGKVRHSSRWLDGQARPFNYWER